MRIFQRKDKELAPLVLQKLADKSSGERVIRHHPVTGERMLVKPSTIAAPGFDYEQMVGEPWPLAGVEPFGELPERCIVSMGYVEKGVAEGWATLLGEKIVHRSGGPAEQPWRVTHTFKHGDELVLHLIAGDVVYRIVENPDKWPEHKDGDTGFGGEVRWTYVLEREW